MKNTTTWLDRLRSRLTGQPVKYYATRRLAREDLHALEEQRARAVGRLTEDIELIDRYVNPLERYMDGDRLLTPLGTILDRRSGKNLPLVWTELDLREFRRWARVICDVNPFAVGFLGLLVDFHIRQGFGWQAVSSFGRTNEEGPGTNEEAIHQCQAILDQWRDSQQWGLRSREAFRRWRRDGELFVRFFRGGSETHGLPVIRFVEPEQVGPPPGEDADGDWSFGILTDHEDVENVQAFFVRDPLGTGSEGDEVPAERILHLKANVDTSIKRGLPDFMSLHVALVRCHYPLTRLSSKFTHLFRTRIIVTSSELERRLLELERRIPQGMMVSSNYGRSEVRPFQVGFPVVLTSTFDSETGYSWKQQVLDLSLPGIDTSALPRTGESAFTPDNNQNLQVGQAGWLEVDPQAQGWIFLPSCCGTTTTTTTTTCSPCNGGMCYWTYSTATTSWTLQSGSCTSMTTSSPGCACNCTAPNFCPATNASIMLPCANMTCNQGPVNCSATTTTPSANCTGSPCPGCQCVWVCLPTGFSSPLPAFEYCLVGALGGGCGCLTDQIPTTCGSCGVTTLTPCSTGTAACSSGTCSWYWGITDPNTLVPGWIQVGLGCTGLGQCANNNCQCDVPSFTPSANPCNGSSFGFAGCGGQTGAPAVTGCYCAQECNQCPSYTSTTCSPSSGACGCTGLCYFQASGSTWTFLSGCPGCTCLPPTTPPISSNQIATTSCQDSPPPTTTTTTTPCPGNCQWVWDCCYDSAWRNNSMTCTGGCNCAYPTQACNCTVKGQQCTAQTMCESGLSTTTQGPFTTTAGAGCPTSTTTTTTGSAVWCCCEFFGNGSYGCGVASTGESCSSVCGGGGFEVSSHSSQASCLANCGSSFTTTSTTSTTTTTASPSCGGGTCVYTCMGGVWVASSACGAACTKCNGVSLSGSCTGPSGLSGTCS